MIAAGQMITYDVQGTTGQWLPRTVAGIRADALDRLGGFFDVSDLSIETPGFLTDPLHYVTNFAYRATLRAATRSDYGDIRDVDSIIGDAFYNATGDLPTVTAADYESGQGDASATAPGGFSLTTGLLLVVIGLIALAVIKVE